MSPKLSVSYSAVLDVRACEQRYWYRYVDKIKPRVTAAPLELGTLIHDCFEAFYRVGMRDGFEYSDEAFKEAKKAALRALRKSSKEVHSFAALAAALGDETRAHELEAIPETARNLMRAYFRVMGKKDLRNHKIIMVEEWFDWEVKPDVFLPGKIDLVTQDSGGAYWLWEHKTTGNIPRPDSRFRDLQTLIYSAALDELFNIKVAGVIWNYIHTKSPKSPKLLKNGTYSVAKGQTLTRELVLEAAKEAPGFEVQPLLDIARRQERGIMFQRFQLPVSAKENVLLRDYVHSVEQIEVMRSNPQYQPIRNITQQCNWCPFQKLCQAVVLGGDTGALMRKHFTRSSKKGGKSSGKETVQLLKD